MALREVTNKAVFLILEYSSLSGLIRKDKKKHKILTFRPLLQEMQLKNLTVRKII